MLFRSATHVDVNFRGKTIKNGIQEWHLNADVSKSWVHGRIGWPHYDAPFGYVQNLYGKSIEEYLAGDNYMILHMQLKLKKAPLSVEKHVFYVGVNHFALESNSVKLITSAE